MRVTFNGKSVHITDREREYAEKKLQRLSRYFRTAREAHVTHSVQRNWQIVEVQLDLDGVLLRAEERASDVMAAFDGVVEKLERQVRRFKGKVMSHKGRADAPTVAAAMAQLAELPEEEAGGVETGPGVVRRKRFAIKPMSVEEASLQMELLNHDFFAFINAETDRVSILYHRRHEGYGLLELDV